MPAHDTDPPKEEFLVHDIPPQLEQALARRARENGRDLSAEAADIIEKHVEEEGDERPAPNRNGAAGLDISPAVRDYLGMKTNDYVDWRFVEFTEVPLGPWSLHGDNNCFIKLRRGISRDLADAAPASTTRAN